jgi:hypothetical protein
MPKQYEELTKGEQQEFLRHIREVTEDENKWLSNTVDPEHEEWLAKEVITKKLKI